MIAALVDGMVMRIAWSRHEKLYMTTPSGGNGSSSQDPNNYSGKVLRLNDDGTAPRRQPPSPDAPDTSPRSIRSVTATRWDLALIRSTGRDVADRDGTERWRRDQTS